MFNKIRIIILLIIMILCLTAFARVEITEASSCCHGVITVSWELPGRPSGYFLREVYLVYAEYFNIAKEGAWLDTADQALIDYGMAWIIRLTNSPPTRITQLHERGLENITDESYRALAEQWGLLAYNLPYKEIINTILGIGGDEGVGFAVTKGKLDTYTFFSETCAECGEAKTENPPTGDKRERAWAYPVAVVMAGLVLLIFRHTPRQPTTHHRPPLASQAHHIGCSFHSTNAP
jgi:hypothetical protein